MFTFSLTGLTSASPVRCPDSKRDAILRGEIAPEYCCSYGICKNDVVVAMDRDETIQHPGSALRYNTK
ncbi:Uu.00g034300.m01.CDS01 [Anthostomella pinea]|uniref:Uu.00g034300.m01.CDS01 n=1 Tax=Anthostomella pinea TaxID=933095 RepID=A0AAI8V9M8_9PEZI|nr:Uu.00g034300.m01.CDS01 [Anthostomella pinea]